MAGWSLAANGDANGDGYDELAIGAINYTGNSPGDGAVFVFYGGPSGPRYGPDWSWTLDYSNADFGDHVVWLDANGDGYSDLVADGGFTKARAFYGVLQRLAQRAPPGSSTAQPTP